MYLDFWVLFRGICNNMMFSGICGMSFCDIEFNPLMKIILGCRINPTRPPLTSSVFLGAADVHCDENVLEKQECLFVYSLYFLMYVETVLEQHSTHGPLLE